MLHFIPGGRKHSAICIIGMCHSWILSSFGLKRGIYRFWIQESMVFKESMRAHKLIWLFTSEWIRTFSSNTTIKKKTAWKVCWLILNGQDNGLANWVRVWKWVWKIWHVLLWNRLKIWKICQNLPGWCYRKLLKQLL